MNTNTEELKPCPCGQVPERLLVIEANVTVAHVFGACCNEWEVAFLYSGEADMESAINAWNDAPRGKQP